MEQTKKSDGIYTILKEAIDKAENLKRLRYNKEEREEAVAEFDAKKEKVEIARKGFGEINERNLRILLAKKSTFVQLLVLFN